MNQGKLIIFSAPSGSGKSTIVRHLLRRDVSIEFSVSATNRTPRGREENGVDYYFLSSEEFKSKINSKAFLEWEEVYPDRYYGTLNAEVDRIWANGKQVVFDIDVEGGLNLKKQFGERALSVFIKAPSLDVLKERLMARNTEDQENLNMRLDKAQSEMAYAKYFDLVIVNDDLEMAQEQAYQKVMDFINEKKKKNRIVKHLKR
ncbi:MAG: guanylate kinase, partial [Flavobacteriales bacterium]|nr:guanylate kinase [Flavobacteriales bacterium]